MRTITVLTGGNGGSRFLSSLLNAPTSETLAGSHNTLRLNVVANTADDLWLHGLKVCPDLDASMQALSTQPAPPPQAPTCDDTHSVREELLAYGVEPAWYVPSDREIGTHLVRTQMLEAGYPLSSVTAAVAKRWNSDVTLLPMTDDRVETHVAVADSESPSGRRVVHLQEYRRSLAAAVPAEAVITVGIDQSTPAPGVLDAITDADVVVLAPSDPTVSIGPILAVPGVREALRATRAQVVGISPLVGARGFDTPTRDDASLLRLLESTGTEPSPLAVALHYGARSSSGVLDAWIVDVADEAARASLADAGIRSAAAPLTPASAREAAAVIAAVLEMSN